MQALKQRRAGEHGKGFSVVASEVRNLAEQTKQSAVQIQQMVQGIKEETTATAGMMSKTMDRFAELDKAVHATEHEFNAISTSISQTIVETDAMAKELNALLEQNDLITKAMQGALYFSRKCRRDRRDHRIHRRTSDSHLQCGKSSRKTQ